MKKLLALVSIFPFVLFAQQELHIVSVTPTGQTTQIDQSQMITVTFSEPMVPLQEAPHDELTGPLKINPPVVGRYRWQGTSTLSFLPQKNLPYASAYTVTIPAGVKSVSGKKLKENFEWRFVTPLPTVISTTPYDKQTSVELDHMISISFNQRINPFQVSKFISLEQIRGKEKSYPKFTTVWDGKSETSVVHLRASEKFLTGAVITVKIKAGVKGVEGMLGMASDVSFWFSTYNEFKFVGIENALPMSPNVALQLKFSSPLFEEELYKHLVFRPDLEVPKRDYYTDYATNVWYISLPLEPAKEYTGYILPGIKDRFNQSINDTVKFTFSTRGFDPVLHMATGFGVLEAYESHRYPLAVLNVDTFRVQMGKVRLEKIVDLLRGFNFSRGWEYDWYNNQENFFSGNVGGTNIFQFDQTITPKLKVDESKMLPINLDTVLGKSKLGVAFVQSSFKKQYYKAIVQVTNLGITAKFSPDDNMIWVTKLKDATPVPNAEIEIRSDENKVVWTGKTDAKGIAKSPGYGKLGLIQDTNPNDDENEWYDYQRKPRLWVFVKHGDDFAFTNSDLDNGIEPWSFGIYYEWNPKFEEKEGTIFSDRGLYKAGEQVDLKAVVRVRKDGSWKIPKGDSVRIIVKNPRDEEIYSNVSTLSMFGSTNATFTLSSSASLGYYNVRLQRKEGKNWKNLSYGNFRVEAFRPAEFEVTAMMDKESYIVGDSISGFLAAKYLFGAPLKNAEVRWRLSVTGESYAPPGFDGYYFEPIYWLSRYSGSEYRELENYTEELDEQGIIHVESKLNVGEINRTVRLMLEGDVTSPNRQVISGRTSVIAHGAEFYLGIGQSSTFVNTDSVLTQKFISVTPEGNFVRGVSIDMKTYRRIWRSVRRAEVGGRYYWTSEIENILVDSATLVSEEKAVERKFIPKEPGFYYTEVSADDTRGNSTSSSSYFYVSGPGYVPWERSNDDRIELIVDKQNYKPGESARIIIKNPYEEATALVSVEREGILNHFTTKVKGSAPQIEIPIKKEFLPNVFVSVVLLQGRVDSIAITRESDIGRPSFKLGYANLPVSPLEKKIVVKIETNKNDFRPGDSVQVTISTTLNTGKGIAAEVALSVADLGVLNLINYRLPKLFDQYYRERGLSVSTTETRSHLIEQRNFDEKGEVIGGGGAAKMMASMDAEGIRKEFRPSAYWNPSIITDAKGKATIKFKLPDNLTAFQLMAIAHSIESDFGFGEHSITVSKPLLLQPSFPRFARVGDRFEGGVVVMNYSDKSKQVKVVTKAEGIAMFSPETAYVTLQPGESNEVRSKLKAETIGSAKFIIRAYTDSDYDGMQWSIPIQVPRVSETVATSSTTTDASAQEQIARPKNIFTDIGSVDVTAASTAMIGLEGSVEYLFDYPYGCLEQKMSRALPIILAADMVKAFNIEILKGKDHRKVVQDLLDEVPQFQGESGGFYYWKGDHSGPAYPYLSAYAMYGLVMAKKNGYRVDENMFRRGFEYIRSELNKPNPLHWYRMDDMTKAMILYVLAENASPDYGHMEKLFARRDSIPLEARAFLLKALVKAKGNKAMIADLVQDFRNMMKISPTTAHFEEQPEHNWWWCWYSQTKTTAVITSALLDAQPDDPFIPKIVRWIMDQQRSGRWRTTQENMYVAAALASYFAIYEKDEPKFKTEVRIAGERILSELFEGRTLKQGAGSLPIGKLPAGNSSIDITKEGTGRLYYTLRMHYYPLDQSKRRDEGFSVLKEVEFLKNENDSVAAIGIGTLAKVTLTISTNQFRSFVVVDDPLPAGFEIVNTSFQTTAQNLDDDEQRNWHFNHRELRDDRALFFADQLPAGAHTLTYLVRVTSYGTFQMPSTRVEQMYEPEVFGQTASKVVRVE
ncbi:MAG: Ig-like domain-containing protein [Bacteroidota bacterium]